MKKIIIIGCMLFIIFVLTDMNTHAKVQDIYGRHVETKVIKILKVSEPPQYYELNNKKYTLQSLEEYVKELQQDESSKIILIWRIEIERVEPYYIIKDLIKVPEYFKGSSISISPAGFKE